MLSTLSAAFSCHTVGHDRPLPNQFSIMYKSYYIIHLVLCQDCFIIISYIWIFLRNLSLEWTKENKQNFERKKAYISRTGNNSKFLRVKELYKFEFTLQTSYHWSMSCNWNFWSNLYIWYTLYIDYVQVFCITDVHLVNLKYYYLHRTLTSVFKLFC